MHSVPSLTQKYRMLQSNAQVLSSFLMLLLNEGEEEESNQQRRGLLSDKRNTLTIVRTIRQVPNEWEVVLTLLASTFT